MKVCLITSSDERCGIATYGQHLMCALPEVEWTVVGHREFASMAPVGGYDLVLVNYEGGLMPDLIPERRFAKGQKKILILHTSHAGNNQSWLTHQFDRVVVHEKTAEGFVHIPMGTPELLTAEELADAGEMRKVGFRFKLGSVGFPFPEKGFPEVSRAAQMLGGPALIIAPVSQHPTADAFATAAKCRAFGATVATGWCDERKVLKMLNCCDAVVFAYHGGGFGISAAVRLGLASGRPVVVNHCPMFRDLLEDYADEVGVAESAAPEHIAAAYNHLVGDEWKKPRRVLEETSWKVVVQKYMALFREVVG